MLLAAIELTDGAVLIAAIGAISAVVSPMLAAALTGRASRHRQQDDWARQDEMAARARADIEEQRFRQELADAQAAETARLLVEADRKHTVDARRLEAKVDQVHVLVNSKLTESMEAQVHALSQLIDLMSADIVRLGTDADPKAVDRRDVAKTELARLQGVLVDRAVATEQANGEVSDAGGQAPGPGRPLPSPTP